MAKLTSSQMYRPGRKWTSRSALETRRFCSNDRGEKIGTRFTACTRVSGKKSEGGAGRVRISEAASSSPFGDDACIEDYSLL